MGWLAGSKEKGIGRDYSGVVVAVGEEVKKQGGWEVGDEVFGLYNKPVSLFVILFLLVRIRKHWSTCLFVLFFLVLRPTLFFFRNITQTPEEDVHRNRKTQTITNQHSKKKTAEGTFTKYLCLSPQTNPIAKKPRSLSHAEAAAIPLVALTAFACLDWLPDPSSSPNEDRRYVVVSGASGGVGSWCVQLAKKLYGCHVTAICSSRNADFVRALGADEVIDYATQDVPASLLSKRPRGSQFDLYVDCVGGTEMFGCWTQLLHRSAAYITIVGDKTERTAMGGPLTYFTYPRQVLRYLRGWLFGPRYANVLLYQKSEYLEQVAELAEQGEVRVVVQDVVREILDEEGYRGAWEKVKGEMVGGRARGKIVVDVSE